MMVAGSVGVPVFFTLLLTIAVCKVQVCLPVPSCDADLLVAEMYYIYMHSGKRQVFCT
jgi:hypothetical protein